MARKTISFTLDDSEATALEASAQTEGVSLGQRAAELVLGALTSEGRIESDAIEDLLLLRGLRDDAIDHMRDILDAHGFSSDITLKTFQRCKADADWLKRYARYIRGDVFSAGNPRKTNANQTIGSRIKSELGARDMLDSNGKSQRGKANNEVIQTYQFLTVD